MEAALRSLILDIIASGRDLTLATIRPDGWPQATTVSYVSEGMTIWLGIGAGSQKAHNIETCNKVSAVIDMPYERWPEIKGISMAATASFVTDMAKLAGIGEMMFEKFPEARDLPPPDLSTVKVVKLTPRIISVLDYSKGHGHTDLVEVAEADITA